MSAHGPRRGKWKCHSLFLYSTEVALNRANNCQKVTNQLKWPSLGQMFFYSAEMAPRGQMKESPPRRKNKVWTPFPNITETKCDQERSNVINNQRQPNRKNISIILGIPIWKKVAFARYHCSHDASFFNSPFQLFRGWFEIRGVLEISGLGYCAMFLVKCNWLKVAHFRRD